MLEVAVRHNDVGSQAIGIHSEFKFLKEYEVLNIAS